MAADTTYNGWKNYETWAVALWIDNEEGSQRHWRDEAAECRAMAPRHPNVRDGIWTAERTPVYLLAERLKAEHEDSRPDLGATVWADLLGAALSEVDWQEIAERLLSE